jgi:tetratricopeptide (TPR) repeat protein
MLRRTPGEADDRIGDVLFESPDWGLVYWDDWAMLFVRRNGRAPRNDEVLASWEFTAFSPRRPQEVASLRGPDLDRAVEELLRLVSWDPESFLPRWALAAARTQQGKGEDAADLYDRLARERAARRNPAFDRSRAEAELVAGRRDAWDRLVRRAGGDPSSPGELFDAASLLGSTGKDEAAMALYREVLAADPAHLDARNNLSLILGRHRRTDEAMVLIGEALARSPGDPYFIASRGEILWWRGDREGALAEFQRALDLLPAEDTAAREEVMRWILQLE